MQKINQRYNIFGDFIKIKTSQNEKANQKTQLEQKNYFKPSTIGDGEKSRGIILLRSLWLSAKDKERQNLLWPQFLPVYLCLKYMSDITRRFCTRIIV